MEDKQKGAAAWRSWMEGMIAFFLTQVNDL